MELKPKTEKSWVWNTQADFADEVPKPETLAIRFKSNEIADEFKQAFVKARNEAGLQEDIASDQEKSEKREQAKKDASDPDIAAVKANQEPPRQSSDDKSDLHTKDSSQEPILSPPKQGESQKEDKEKSPISKEKSPTTGFLFGSASISSLSFATVAANLSTSPELKGKDDKKEFEGAGPQIFSSSPSPRKESESEDHHNIDPHFEPIIPLPEKIEVKSGEEDEDVAFSHRSKLYRFDKESKQWKERGVGDIKILNNKRDGRIRILMRRDHILKICANHYITPEMKLLPGTNNKTWVWTTLADYSDEEVKQEQLAVRFKLETIAHEFKRTFEECQEKVKQLKTAPSKEDEIPAHESGYEPADQPDKGAQSFMDKFKLKPGMWECEVCCVSNEQESTSCVACQTPKPGSIPQKTSDSLKDQPKFQLGAPLKPPHSSGFTFNFGTDNSKPEPSSSVPVSQMSLADMFKPKPGEWECDACLVKNKPDSTSCAACQTKRTSRGTVATSSSSQPSSGPEPNGFSFGLSKQSPFSFGAAPPESEQPSSLSSLSGPKPTGFSFGTTKNENQSPLTFGSETPLSDSSVMDKFQPKAGTWECEACFVQNEAEHTSCIACQTRRSDVSSNAVSSSSGETKALSSVGITKPTGFTFGSSNNDNQKPFSFGTAGPKSTGFSFGSSGGDNQKPFSFGFSLASPNVDTHNKPEESTQSSHEQGKDSGDVSGDTKSKEPLMDKFKPKPGSWECEACLVSNISNLTVCAACQTPKPGEKPSTAQPSFNFGTSVPSGFSFNPLSTANQKPVSFGQSGFSFPQVSFPEPSEGEKDKVDGEQQFGDPKPTGFSFGSKASDSPGQFSFGLTNTAKEQASLLNSADNSTAQSKDPNISVTAPQISVETKSKEKDISKDPLPVKDDICSSEKEGTDLTVLTEKNDVTKAEADSTSLPEIQEIIPESNNQNVSSSGTAPEESDPLITSVVEPSNEEKNRAKALMLPEGFFLYQRKPHDLKDSKNSKKELDSVTDTTKQHVEQNKDANKESPKLAAVFGSSSSQPFASFSDVAGKGFQFGSNKPTKGFAGKGSQVFSSNSKEGDEEHPDEERDIHFEPIVQLPKVEVSTGEEKEKKLFSHRAKLYRFDQPTSIWKERGTGDIKILKLKDANKFRVLMRRDQIHKLCANHLITSEMKLVPNAMSERSWVWHTLADVSEEEPTSEKFAVRFKSSDVAKDFKNVFEECQQEMQRESVEDSKSDQPSNSEGVDDDEKVEHPVQMPKALQEIGRKLSDAGELLNDSAIETFDTNVSTAYLKCASCYVSNPVAEQNCQACGEPKKEDQLVNIQSKTVQESKDKKTSDECDSTEESIAEEKPKTGFLFGTQSVSSLSFGDAAAKSNLFGASSSTAPFSFKGLNDPKPAHDGKEDEDHDEEGYHNVSGDHIHFDPLIPLPEKVEVVTGEEEEDVSFKERARMYRYDKDLKQWKERGTGELKILSSNRRARIVMRRDHTHKVCANHIITPDMELKPNGSSDRSWVWQTLADISEEEAKPEQLAVRFKTAEIANAFKKTFQECTSQELPSSTTHNEDDGKSTDKPTSDEPEDVKPKDTSDDLSESEEKALVPMPENTQDLATSSPSRNELSSDTQSKVIQQSIHTSSTITKRDVRQQSTTITTSRVETTATSQTHQQQKAEVSTKETKAAELTLQDKAISSSSEAKPQDPQFQEISSSSPPSIFNQALLQRQSAGFFPRGTFQFGQRAAISSSVERPQFPEKQFGQQPDFPSWGNFQFAGESPGSEGFTKVTSSTQQTMSKRTEMTSKKTEGQTVEESKVVQQIEARKVEARETVSSSGSTSSEKQLVSCSPEITEMLQEIEDSDKK